METGRLSRGRKDAPASRGRLVGLIRKILLAMAVVGSLGLLAKLASLPPGPDAFPARLAGAAFATGAVVGWLAGEMARRRGGKAARRDSAGAVPGVEEAWRVQRDATVRAERMAMAAELHDSVAQALSHWRQVSVRLDRRLAEEGGSPGAAALAADLRDGLARTYAELRALLSDFRLGRSTEGLAQAIRHLVRSFGGRTGMSVRLDLEEKAAAELSPGQQHEVLLILGEALANVARHARAGSVTLAVRRTREGAILAVVEDDGRGIERMVGGTGRFGLEIMRERASRAGGELAITDRPGGGTRLTLRIHPGQDARPHGMETKGAPS